MRKKQTIHGIAGVHSISYDVWLVLEYKLCLQEDFINISIFADKNPQPLAASFILPEGTAADVSVRIRLGETQVVSAVVESDGKLYTTEQEVKVTIGGCGG